MNLAAIEPAAPRASRGDPRCTRCHGDGEHRLQGRLQRCGCVLKVVRSRQQAKAWMKLQRMRGLAAWREQTLLVLAALDPEAAADRQLLAEILDEGIE